MNGTSHLGRSPRLTPAIQRNVARVLLADSDLASRLTLKTLLSKAGYAVDGAASASEAIGHLDVREYQLVLADLRTESGEAGQRLLAYARQKEFRPATALISSRMSEMENEVGDAEATGRVVSISDANLAYLLARVAELIAGRANRRIQSRRRAS
jgi:CheY-like chemotaxis protein